MRESCSERVISSVSSRQEKLPVELMPLRVGEQCLTAPERLFVTLPASISVITKIPMDDAASRDPRGERRECETSDRPHRSDGDGSPFRTAGRSPETSPWRRPRAGARRQERCAWLSTGRLVRRLAKEFRMRWLTCLTSPPGPRRRPGPECNRRSAGHHARSVGAPLAPASSRGVHDGAVPLQNAACSSRSGSAATAHHR